MRRAYLMLVALLPSAGCSYMVANSGTHLERLETRDQVRATLGTPVASGTEDGAAYEDFRSHRKIATAWWKGEYYLMPWVATWGLVDVVLLPLELGRAVRQTVAGQDVRVAYGPDGKVRKVAVDGEWFPWLPHRVSESIPTDAADRDERSDKSNRHGS